MQHKNSLRTNVSIRVVFAVCISILLSFLLLFPSVFSELFGENIQAYALRSDELKQERDEIFNRIDELQSELNEANAQLEQAQNESRAAQAAMEEAAVREEYARARQKDLQEALRLRVASMYRTGSSTFIDVLFGSSSFEEFLTKWDMFQRIAQQNANMVVECKRMKQEAEDAKNEYARQKAVHDEQAQRAAELVASIEATKAELQENANRITEEIAEAEAKEEEEAKAAAAAAAAANAMGYFEAGESVISGNGQFCNPCPGAVSSSGYGYRSFDNSFHKGVDMAAPEGTPYYAADSGTVIYATYNGGYNGGAGNWIVISHGGGLVTKYMHSSVVFVRVGDTVTRGQNIGLVGNTGNSFGAHLHFQVEVRGAAVNPFAFL